MAQSTIKGQCGQAGGRAVRGGERSHVAFLLFYVVP